MNAIKNISFLIAITSGLCLNAVSINPVHSSEISDTHNDEIIISQLKGHDTYNGGVQQQWGEYSLGRVIGKSGNIMSIETKDGNVFQATGSLRSLWDPRPGSDVLVGVDENGDYYLVRAAESEWISYLESDYDWKR